jgi:hypothetical protein
VEGMHAVGDILTKISVNCVFIPALLCCIIIYVFIFMGLSYVWFIPVFIFMGISCLCYMYMFSVIYV